MPFSKCLRAKIYSNMNVYFDPQGCQTLLLKESDPIFFSLGSWTNNFSFNIFLEKQNDFKHKNSCCLKIMFSTIKVKSKKKVLGKDVNVIRA